MPSRTTHPSPLTPPSTHRSAVGPEGGGPFDAVVVYQGGVQGREKEDAGDALVESLVRGDGLQEVAGVLRQGGRLCLQAVMRTEDKWALMRSLWESSMTVVYSARLKVPGGAPGHDRILRLVAVLPKLGEKADDE